MLIKPVTPVNPKGIITPGEFRDKLILAIASFTERYDVITLPGTSATIRVVVSQGDEEIGSSSFPTIPGLLER